MYQKNRRSMSDSVNGVYKVLQPAEAGAVEIDDQPWKIDCVLFLNFNYKGTI
jgi:hypothetical protein